MLGNPGETKETLIKNIEYAIELNPDFAIFNITTPYPGTDMFTWADENDYLLSRDWRDYDLSRPVLNLPTVSPDEVMMYYRLAHRKFYLRFKQLWKISKKIFSPSCLSIIHRGVKILMGA